MQESEVTPGATGRPFIKRPRLTRVLDEAQASVIMLVAPAGYGKTTLAHEWLDGREAPHAWHTCIPASSDVAALSVGIAEAAESVLPGAAERVATRLRVTNAPESEVDVLAEILAEDLADWPERAWLCLDDYHFTRRSQAAEHFVERLLALSPVRLLIATRERPTWATPRRILYGELVEIGTSALAMTRDEAGQVLSARPKRLPGLLALTDGWPAAIGLAALMPELDLPEDALPTPLYDYIAEELYQSVDPVLQVQLCELAVLPRPTRDALEHLFGAASQPIAEDAVRLGFLIRSEPHAFDLHPLLRAFLESKLRERGDHYVTQVVDRVARYLTERCLWDDAFALASRFRRGDLLAALIDESLYEMLSHGRLPTLLEWLATDHDREKHPMLTLAEAEVVFRQGDNGRAETLALQAAASLPVTHPNVSQAFYRAGQSAALSDRADAARTHFTEARRTARCDADVRRALWGQLANAWAFEPEVARTLVEELAELGTPTADDALRLATGRAIADYGLGTVVPSLERSRAILHLFDGATDPMIRSSFLSSLAITLVLSAHYREATTITGMLMREVEEYRLPFVLPHALIMRAATELGQRKFAAALGDIVRAKQIATEHGDHHSEVNAATLLLLLRISGRSAESGLREAEPAFDESPSPALAGELLAARALAFACVGAGEDAAAFADRAESLSRHPEVRVLSAATRTINALGAGRPTAATVTRLAEAVRSTGNYDSFIVAYRGFPDLLGACRDSLPSNELRRALAEATDVELARRYGITGVVTDRRPRARGLSKREHDVLALIAQGMQNREIARTLFISESTAKVHVRNLLRKLNVRSRTEAALMAKDVLAGRSDADVGHDRLLAGEGEVTSST